MRKDFMSPTGQFHYWLLLMEMAIGTVERKDTACDHKD